MPPPSFTNLAFSHDWHAEEMDKLEAQLEEEEKMSASLKRLNNNFMDKLTTSNREKATLERNVLSLEMTNEELTMCLNAAQGQIAEQKKSLEEAAQTEKTLRMANRLTKRDIEIMERQRLHIKALEQDLKDVTALYNLSKPTPPESSNLSPIQSVDIAPVPATSVPESSSLSSVQEIINISAEPATRIPRPLLTDSGTQTELVVSKPFTLSRIQRIDIALIAATPSHLPSLEDTGTQTAFLAPEASTLAPVLNTIDITPVSATPALAPKTINSETQTAPAVLYIQPTALKCMFQDIKDLFQYFTTLLYVIVFLLVAGFFYYCRRYFVTQPGGFGHGGFTSDNFCTRLHASVAQMSLEWAGSFIVYS